MCYINSSLGCRQIGFIGDPPEALEMAVFSDADFAGDREDAKSTTGIFVALTGPHSFYPLTAASKKQTAVSNSTPEAEVVAAFDAIRLEALPLLDVWEEILGRKVRCTLYENKQACIAIIKSGRFPKMRHVKR